MERTDRPTAKRDLIAALIAIAAFVGVCYTAYSAFVSTEGFDDADGLFAGLDCNVSAIELHGELFTYPLYAEASSEEAGIEYTAAYSQDIVSSILDAEGDESVKAILIEIDSYGGMPVAAEEVANALRSAAKPTVALIRQAGLSASYWAATGADVIIASRNSDVGSIGVTMSYLVETEKDRQEGLSYMELASGKYKDAGTPHRALSDEERRLFMRDVNKIHGNFVEDVARNRELPIEAVESLADGSSMLGDMALENGLVDRVGGYSEAEEALSGLMGEKASICWR